MKYLFIIMLGLSLSANEMDRIESIVQDIENIRADYATCSKSLEEQKKISETRQSLESSQSKKYKTMLDEEIAKNKSLVLDLNMTEDYKNNLYEEKLKNTALLEEIDSLNKEINKKEFEKQVKDLNIILKTKENEINNLKNKIAKLEKSKESIRNNLLIEKNNTITCVDDNIFPTLIMRDNKVIQKKKNFTPATFELLRNASIYNSINGNKLEEWEEKTLFTSNVKTQNWMKITGHFVEDKWQRSKKELWIKIENIKMKTNK